MYVHQIIIQNAIFKNFAVQEMTDRELVCQ